MPEQRPCLVACAGIERLPLKPPIVVLTQSIGGILRSAALCYAVRSTTERVPLNINAKPFLYPFASTTVANYSMAFNLIEIGPWQRYNG